MQTKLKLNCCRYIEKWLWPCLENTKWNKSEMKWLKLQAQLANIIMENWTGDTLKKINKIPACLTWAISSHIWHLPQHTLYLHKQNRRCQRKTAHQQNEHWIETDGITEKLHRQLSGKHVQFIYSVFTQDTQKSATMFLRSCCSGWLVGIHTLLYWGTDAFLRKTLYNVGLSYKISSFHQFLRDS